MKPLKEWDNLKKGYRFGDKTFYNDFHLGIDLSCKVGTPIYAFFDGVLKNSKGKESGFTATLSNGIYTIRHLHLSQFAKEGKVKKGDIIGYTGGAKGAEGSGLSTGAHVHIDVWKGKVDLSSNKNLINPDDFFQEINILVVGADDYDLTDLVAENPYFNITKKIKDLTPKWVSINGEIEVDQNWFDLNVWESGYDIIALVTKDYKRTKTTGYAQRKQSLGTYRCFVHDTGLPRIQGRGNGWRSSNQVAGTLEHEIYHCLHYGLKIEDKTHDLDKGLGFPVLALSKFKGFKIPGYVRLFKKSFYTGNMKERIIKEDLSIPSLYERFGFKK